MVGIDSSLIISLAFSPVITFILVEIKYDQKKSDIETIKRQVREKKKEKESKGDRGSLKEIIDKVKLDAFEFVPF